MKNFRITLTILVSFCCMATSHAQTISWQKAPQWDNVEMLGENLVLVTQAGKQGVIKLSGTQIISCGTERIFGVKDQRFLVLGTNNKLVSLWDENGNQITFSGNYFVDGAWPYYSGGMLPVKDEKGFWGFLNLDGNLIIPCKFAAAFPFVNGQASVCYKDGLWAHIGTDGKPVLIKGQKLRSKKIRFASTFTQIGDRLLSLVSIEDFMYFIDLSGDVASNTLISSEGQPQHGAGIGPQIVAGSFTVRFNNIGEVDTIIKNGTSHSFSGRSLPNEVPFPNIAGFNTFDSKGFAVGEIVTASQFQRVIPISTLSVLAQYNGKWGIIGIDRQATCPSIKEGKNLKSLRLEHATGIMGSFYISKHPANTEVYIVDKRADTRIIETTGNGDSYFDAPLSFEDGKLRVSLGLILDGIRLEPKDFTIVPEGFDKSFAVSCPTTATVSEGGKVSFRITITNTSNIQDTAPFDIRVNGGVVKRSVTLNQGESTTFPVTITVNLGEEDRVNKSVEIRISEQNCPIVSFSKTITCIRQLKED